MDDNRRKLPSWMLGVKNNENNSDISNNNGCPKEENNGKLVKALAKRVNVKKRNFDGDDDEFERESSDVPRVCDGENMVNVKKRNFDGDDDEFERESSDVPRVCDGENMVTVKKRGNDGVDDEFEVELSDELRRGEGITTIKVNGGCSYVEGENESREGKKKDRGMGHKMKGNVVDDMVDDDIGYGKRKNSTKVRKVKLRNNLVDGDNGIPREKRSNRGRKWKGKGKSDEADDDDGGGGGAQAVLRKCKGKGRADKGKLVDSNNLASISDDEDLTVEDLVSIAEEYISKDMEAAHQLSLSQGISNVGNVMKIRKEHPKENEDICENNASEKSIHDNTQPGGSSSREEAESHSLLNENVTVMKPIMTGDPTQDMLDLFLGHLLKRPQEEEKKSDISFDVQTQVPVAAPVDAVPFTKKKSSLKDKVAMFFD